jgi:hypothetical protein
MMVYREVTLRESVAENGFSVIDSFVSDDVVESLLSAVTNKLGSDRAGTRQLHQRVPDIGSFLRRPGVVTLIQELLPGGFPVRSILFDKTPETNWRVAWHQDLSICVKERHDIAGFSAWSVKEGIHHVHPPTGILERMRTLRLHLDDCDQENGPLRVIPGSHRKGRLTSAEIAAWRNKGPVETCVVPRGGAVIMKPLLLHSSTAATNPRHRRVLHIEFASEALPTPLEWIS